MASQLGRIRSEGFSDSHQYDAPAQTPKHARKKQPEKEIGGVAPPRKALTPLASGRRVWPSEPEKLL